MPGRSFTSSNYRYGFNGKEKDDEIKGNGNSLDFGARLYDSRLGKFLSIDKKFMINADIAPYTYAANNPIALIDKDGDEPRWGQLANLRQILGEMARKIIKDKIYGKSFHQQLEAMSAHFEANRFFTRDKEGKLVDAKGSQNVRRYIYTEKMGWIDMHHFFRVASIADSYGTIAAVSYGEIGEGIQDIQGKKGSADSYEDRGSNMLGALFVETYGDKIKSGEITLLNAVEKFLKAYNPVEPEKAPNIDYIPHKIEPEHSLTTKKIGLKGSELKEAHSKVYEGRDEESKQRIRDAHEQIER